MDKQTKQCVRCGEIKLLLEFRETKYGVRSQCKECGRKDSKAWAKNNSERYHKTSREWRWNNLERVKVNEKIYRSTHKDYLHDKRVKRHLKNIEKERARSSRWQKEHPDRARIASRNRRAIIAGASGNGWSVEEERRLVEDYNHRCAYCGKKFDNLTMDHIIPITRGGIHSIENIVPACNACNISKSNKPLLIWLYEKRREKWTNQESILL